MLAFIIVRAFVVRLFPETRAALFSNEICVGLELGWMKLFKTLSLSFLFRYRKRENGRVEGILFGESLVDNFGTKFWNEFRFDEFFRL